MWRWLALHLSLLLPTSSSGIRHGDGDSRCTVAHFGAVPDNATDNTAAFRAAFASSCDEVVVPPGTWMTGPFNLSSHTVLRVFGTISGSRDPTLYPVVIQQPLDEAYRAPYMHNRQQRVGLVEEHHQQREQQPLQGALPRLGLPRGLPHPAPEAGRVC